MIDFLATEIHFDHHLLPIWRALNEDERGRLWSKDPTPGETPVLVASYTDMRRARRARRPVIYMEHGAGQSYAGVKSGSYIGGDREGVIGVLAPSEAAADRQRGAHPSIPVHVVGCPKLDAWHQLEPSRSGLAGLAFHWNCTLAPETRSAFTHYRGRLSQLAIDAEVLGHGHPRIFDSLAPLYRRAKIESTGTFADVVARCRVYAVDNSSTLFEFAALDRPVVVLNAPWYRRQINHGMRFWEFADIGIQVDSPRDLAAAIKRSLADDPQRDRRHQIVEQVYGPLDGQATARAVAAIRALV